MTRNMPRLAVVSTAILSLACMGTAASQTPPAGTTELGNITVVAPRVTYERDYSPGRAAPRQVRVTQQSTVVDASDLDLSRIADMETLKSRVDVAAQQVCDELIRQYPLGQPDAAACVRRANEDTMAQVRIATGRVAGK